MKKNLIELEETTELCLGSFAAQPRGMPMNLSPSKCETLNCLPFMCGCSQRVDSKFKKVKIYRCHARPVLCLNENIEEKALEGPLQHPAFSMLPLATTGPRCYSFP